MLLLCSSWCSVVFSPLQSESADYIVGGLECKAGTNNFLDLLHNKLIQKNSSNNATVQQINSSIE